MSKMQQTFYGKLDDYKRKIPYCITQFCSFLTEGKKNKQNGDIDKEIILFYTKCIKGSVISLSCLPYTQTYYINE